MTVALEALRLHKVWEDLPQDRGGANGPKGRALQAFLVARDSALSAQPADDTADILKAVDGYVKALNKRANGHWTEQYLDARDRLCAVWKARVKAARSLGGKA